MSKKINNDRGVTIVALAITIIVLLMITTISVKIVIDGGLVGRAESTTSNYKIKEEKEHISAGYLDYQKAKMLNSNVNLTVEGADVIVTDAINGWTVTFKESGNRYSLTADGEIGKAKEKTEDEKLLERYIVGKNGENKKLTEIITLSTGRADGSFINDDVMPDASSKLEFLYEDFRFRYDSEAPNYMYFKYNNKGYRITFQDYEGKIESVELIYEKTGREGEKVRYSYDGTPENEEEWTILYDYGDSVEIVSSSAIGTIRLGYGDEQAIGTDNIEKAIYSYNNVMKRINNYTSSLITNSDKISARSVGSNPYNPLGDTNTMYKSEELEKLNPAYNGRGKNDDKNFEQDITRLFFYGIAKSSNNKEYFINSRKIYEINYDSISFNIGRMYHYYSNGTTATLTMYDVKENGEVFVYNPQDAVRPVVKVKKADLGL